MKIFSKISINFLRNIQKISENCRKIFGISEIQYDRNDSTHLLHHPICLSFILAHSVIGLLANFTGSNCFGESRFTLRLNAAKNTDYIKKCF